ncbi:hypothetical protein BJX99DRAFT_234339 [Aspergillus californicus]
MIIPSVSPMDVIALVTAGLQIAITTQIKSINLIRLARADLNAILQASHDRISRSNTPVNFSTGKKRYFIKGDAGGRLVEALPDSGADMCTISTSLATELGLSPVPGTDATLHLANKKPVQSPGMVKMPWRFEGEPEAYSLDCWLLPQCIQDLVLGSSFLRATRTFTTFSSRIKSKLTNLPRRPRLCYIGGETQRVCGYLDDRFTTAFPDTGSDVMLISRAYATELALHIDSNPKDFVEIEFADRTTAWTSGIVRDVPWRIGNKSVNCDFYVLNQLCEDVVLSNDYLFDMNVFADCSDYFYDAGLEDPYGIHKLCNIRLVGRYSDCLNCLEEEFLQDVNSPDAFSVENVQRELARRDKIRDEIRNLPEDLQVTARIDEMERQRRWQTLRQVHKERWKSQTSLDASTTISTAHRTETHSGQIPPPQALIVGTSQVPWKARWGQRMKVLTWLEKKL